MKNYLRRIIAAMLLGVCVYAAFALYSGYEDIASKLAGFRWPAFAAACTLAFTNYLLRFGKWEYYLHKLGVKGVRKSDSLLIFLSGFVLTVTPGKVGEVFKSLLLKETHGVPVAKTATIVVAERLTDLVGVIVLILLGSIGFRGGMMWAVLGSVVALTCLVVIMSRTLSEVLIRLFEKLPRVGTRLGPKVRESWDSLRVMTTPGALLLPTALSVGAWAMEGFALYVILRGFGESVPIAPAMFFYATATLAGALIPVPGGLGVTESALAGQLKLLGGVSTAASTASMILVRFATLWFAVLVGFCALGLLRLRYPNCLGSAETPSAQRPSQQRH